MQIEKKTLRRIFFGVVGCILLYWVLHQSAQVGRVLRFLGSILSPFVIGAAMAFVLNVPMRAYEKRLKKIKKAKLRRTVAILLTVLSVLLVLSLVIALLIPQLINTGEKLVNNLPGFYERSVTALNNFLNKHPDLLKMVQEYTNFENIDWSVLLENILSKVSGGMSSAAGAVVNAIFGIFSGLYNAILSIFFCFYALASKETLARQARRMAYAFLPEKVCDETIRILRMGNSAFANFLTGQCLEALILGAMFAVTMSIFGMPYTLLISVLIAVTALIPVVGSFAGCIIGAFLIFTNDPVQAFWFVVMFLLLQQLEEQLIYPRVVGTSVGLPGLWVIVAVGVGGGLMGVAGMLIMIPIMSVLYALAREISSKRVAARGIDPEKLKAQPLVVSSNLKNHLKAKQQARAMKRESRKESETENNTETTE